jgi:hypothetical protein
MRDVSAHRESGQVAVEAAIVMPMMVFLTLGILQLTMVQHARLMTEYAAYQAARAGIVWNGNPMRMHDAAVIALLPTFGRTDDLTQLGRSWERHQRVDKILRQVAWGPAGVPQPDELNGANLFGLVRVDTISPASFPAMASIWKLRDQGNWEELDFDGPETFPEVPALDTKIQHFFNLPLPDDSETAYRKSTRLTIRLRYWYEMRVPFANQVIFTSWFATNAGVALGGILGGPVSGREAIEGQWQGIGHQRGWDTVTTTEMATLWALSNGDIDNISDQLGGKKYYLPLSATHTMRMQSNFYEKWLMHRQPDWGF